MLWLFNRARARLGGESRIEDRPSPRQVIESRPTTIFLTVFARGQILNPDSRIGTGNGLLAALDSALDSIKPSKSASEPDRVQIDVLKDSFIPLGRPDDFTGLSAARLIDIGAEGLAVRAGKSTYYLMPAEIIYRSIVDDDPDAQSAADLLDRVMTYTHLSPGAWRSSAVRLSRFRTISFIENAARDSALKLTGALVTVEEPSKQTLLSAARSGGDYLIRAQKPTGRFYYSYEPLEDKINTRGYNIVRHAGAAFSLFELYSVTRDSRYLEAARQAISFLKSRFRAARDKDSIYVLDNDGKAKLGANGLALVALARQIELDPQSSDRKNAEQLAHLILALQRKDGSFRSYHPVRGDEPEGSVSLYYPGEAILGLVMLYRVNGDRRLLDSARRGANYLIASERKMDRLPPDAWLMQALEALCAVKREPEYVEHAMRLAEAMMADQYAANSPAGYPGGFGPGMPRSTPAAARAEGMVAAYRLARLTGDARAPKILASLKSSARFQLSQQFDADNSFFLPNPERATGGFRAGMTSMRIRIDFVQHSISALLGLAQII